VDLEVTGRLKGRAQAAHASLIGRSQSQEGKNKSADARFARQIMSSGTLSDRIAAMTLMVQSDPVTHLSTLDQLLAMSRKR